MTGILWTSSFDKFRIPQKLCFLFNNFYTSTCILFISFPSYWYVFDLAYEYFGSSVDLEIVFNQLLTISLKSQFLKNQAIFRSFCLLLCRKFVVVLTLKVNNNSLAIFRFECCRYFGFRWVYWLWWKCSFLHRAQKNSVILFSFVCLKSTHELFWEPQRARWFSFYACICTRSHQLKFQGNRVWRSRVLRTCGGVVKTETHDCITFKFFSIGITFN